MYFKLYKFPEIFVFYRCNTLILVLSRDCFFHKKFLKNFSTYKSGVLLKQPPILTPHSQILL